MTVATITPAAPKAAAKPKAPKVAAPTATEIEATIAAIRNRWTKAEASEATTWAQREAADIAWQNARVIKVRVAFAAAMVKPEKGGTNLLNAARILLTDPKDTPAERTKVAKQKKNTLRNYVDAGAALQAEGLAMRITEPDAVERKIVADAFREGNKRAKAEEKAGSEVETSGGVEAPTPEAEAALTATDLVGHIGRMQATLKAIVAASVVVSEEEAATIADMLADFQTELAAYAEGK